MHIQSTSPSPSRFGSRVRCLDERLRSLGSSANAPHESSTNRMYPHSKFFVLSDSSPCTFALTSLTWKTVRSGLAHEMHGWVPSTFWQVQRSLQVKAAISTQHCLRTTLIKVFGMDKMTRSRSLSSRDIIYRIKLHQRCDRFERVHEDETGSAMQMSRWGEDERGR